LKERGESKEGAEVSDANERKTQRNIRTPSQATAEGKGNIKKVDSHLCWRNGEQKEKK